MNSCSSHNAVQISWFCLIFFCLVGATTARPIVEGLDIPSASGFVLGFDHSSYQEYVSVDSYACLRQNNFSFGVIEALKPDGTLSPYVIQNLQNAKAAGFTHLDVYVFFNVQLSAAMQIEIVVTALQKVSGISGRLWFDIEAPQQWSNPQANQQFLENARTQANKLGVPIGVYSTMYLWNAIMGSYSNFSNEMLWYADYDGSPAFTDFTTFGGWTVPTVKQYQGTTNLCGTQVDYNAAQWSVASPSVYPTPTPTPTQHSPSVTPSRSPSPGSGCSGRPNGYYCTTSTTYEYCWNGAPRFHYSCGPGTVCDQTSPGLVECGYKPSPTV